MSIKQHKLFYRSANN